MAVSSLYFNLFLCEEEGLASIYLAGATKLDSVFSSDL